MKLGYNWFYRPRIDVELKQYETLAFVQYLEKCLDAREVVPPLTELHIQQSSISQFMASVVKGPYAWSKKITGVDAQQGRIHYAISRDNSLHEVEHIAGFLWEHIGPFVPRFEALRAEAMQDIQVSAVGVLPVYRNEGWMLVPCNHNIDAYLYRQHGLLNDKGAGLIQADFYRSFAASGSPAHIKQQLIKEYSSFPNPATYFVHSIHTWPLHTTFLPLAMEKVLQQAA